MGNIEWFEVILWLLITAYGITGIGNLIACMPNPHKDISDILKTNDFSYSFWLISSLILFIFGIRYLDSSVLSRLTAIEMILVIIAYIIMVPIKHKQIKKYKQTELSFKKMCKKKTY